MPYIEEKPSFRESKFLTILIENRKESSYSNKLLDQLGSEEAIKERGIERIWS